MSILTYLKDCPIFQVRGCSYFILVEEIEIYFFKKLNVLAGVQWGASIVLATQEAEAGRVLEHRHQRPAT